jgi:hypothetical protein
MNKERQRFEDLCFIYACGKADAADAAWLEQMLAQHPDWQAILDGERALVQAGRAAQAAQRASQPELLSVADIMALADIANAEADAPMEPLRPARAAAAAGWLDRLRGWWQRPLQGGYAYAAMAVLVLAVSVQTYRLEQVPPDAVYRSVPAAAAGAQLRVRFDDRISTGELSIQLSTLGLSIVHGPDRSGAYLIDTGGAEPARAAEQLRAAHLVLDVQLLPPTQQGKPQ